MKRSQNTAMKRQREQAKRERRQMKEERRAQRKTGEGGGDEMGEVVAESSIDDPTAVAAEEPK